MEKSQIIEVLENCELFRGLDRSDIEKISGLCGIESYENGDEVFHQGDLGERIYIIAEGYVFLERSMDMGTRKGNVTIGILGKGRVFGCWSTLLEAPHNLMSTAICQKPTKVLVVRGRDLREMMIKNFDFGFHVLEKLCFVLRDRIHGAFGAMEKI